MPGALFIDPFYFVLAAAPWSLQVVTPGCAIYSSSLNDHPAERPAGRYHRHVIVKRYLFSVPKVSVESNVRTYNLACLNHQHALTEIRTLQETI